MRINKRKLINIFLISLFLFKIPSFYILPFFQSSFFTSQALARVLISFLFFYHYFFNFKEIENLIKKRKYFILLFFLLFFIQSISVLPAINIIAFLSRYKDIIFSFFAFFVFYFYKSQYKKIISVFIFSLLVNFTYQILIIYLHHLSIDLLKNLIYQKHFDLVLAKLNQGKVYLDTYDEIVIPFLLTNLSLQNFTAVILNIFFSLISNIRSRILMMVGAVFFSLFLLAPKIDKKKIMFFLFIFLIIAYFVNNLMIRKYGFSYLTRILLEEESSDIGPINFRKTQLENAFSLANGNFLGTGLGNYFDNINALEKNKNFLITKSQKITYYGAQEYVHNILGLILSELGFVGLLVFLLIILWFVKQDLLILMRNGNDEQKALIIAFWSLFLYGLFNPIIPASYQVLFWGIRGLLID